MSLTKKSAGLKTVKNSIEVRQATEPVAAEDDIDINCFFVSDHNSKHVTFTLPIARSKFNTPLARLRDDVKTSLLAEYAFHARLPTILFHTLKVPPHN
ncbi:hypothetical protein EUX98_g9468 [Antrodiella citrinella]|uniref:Uncharacterized protein n=1 Tax=Antrodiella citrinella TaxID=2447956 RepID=A0A4S4LSQ1_9APHY|nr:hypothetical protein EUX98_g9468 [Antrodiella citrinella]